MVQVGLVLCPSPCRLTATLQVPGNFRFTYGRPRVTSGFPACCLAYAANSDQTTFADALLCVGHGYPLLEPKGVYADDSDQDLDGLRLGDVGHLDGAGRFTAYFNIFQTKRTDRSYLPRRYTEIQPQFSEWEVRHIPQYFPPGTVIAGRGVDVTLLSSSVKVKINRNGVRGGIIALPDGASRQDLVNIDALRPYIEQHALDWYQYANSYSRDPSQMNMSNGTLYLITGVDVAPRWATGVLKASSPMEFEYHGAGNDWCPRGAVYEDNYSPRREMRGNIFIRGLRIALGSALWNRYMPRKDPWFVPIFALLTPWVDADLPLFYRWKLRARKLLRRKQIDIANSRGEEHPAHPSLILLQAMLVKAPSSNVLMVDDRVWSSINATNFQYPDIFNHVIQILDANDVKIIDGIAVLVPKDKPPESGPVEQGSMTRMARFWLSLVGRDSEDFQRRRRLDLWRAVHQIDPI